MHVASSDLLSICEFTCMCVPLCILHNFHRLLQTAKIFPTHFISAILSANIYKKVVFILFKVKLQNFPYIMIKFSSYEILSHVSLLFTICHIAMYVISDIYSTLQLFL